MLGVNKDLVKRCYITLCVLASNFEIDAVKLEEFNRETLELYVEQYSWYNMPQAVHKMLVHSHAVVAVKCVPVGALSEEPQESSNKVFKASREHFTRKISRIATNTDLIRRMLTMSDPLGASLRRSQEANKKEKTLPVEALALLKTAD